MRLLLIIIAISVVTRIASAVYQGATIEAMPGVTDQISYHELAVRVVQGHGFSFGTGWWPATGANQPTAHWSFLYVLFLAAIYAILGPMPLAARLIQASLVGILHPFLVWRIGRRLFNSTVGLVSAAVTAIYGYFVFYAGALVTESLYMLSFLWVLDVATALAYSPRGGDRLPSRKQWILLGVAFAVAVLLRQVLLLVVPLILGWIAWELFRQRDGEGFPLLALAGRMALTVAILLACILPWSVRNYKAFGQFVLLNTNAGFVFFWANHPVHGTEFIPIMSSYGAVNYGTLLPQELRGLNEAEVDRALLIRGIGFVKDDPERYVRLSINRAKEYFKFWPSNDSSTASNFIRVLSSGLFFPFILFGVLQTVARRTGDAHEDRRGMPGAALLMLVAALYSLVHLLTWTLVRYRLPVDAILMPFAGLAIVSLLHRFASLLHVPDVSLPSSAN